MLKKDINYFIFIVDLYCIVFYNVYIEINNNYRRYLK
nr:MAG TPA: hypothetical protein [Caudoviricetes sp.]